MLKTWTQTKSRLASKAVEFLFLKPKVQVLQVAECRFRDFACLDSSHSKRTSVRERIGTWPACYTGTSGLLGFGCEEAITFCRFLKRSLSKQLIHVNTLDSRIRFGGVKCMSLMILTFEWCCVLAI